MHADSNVVFALLNTDRGVKKAAAPNKLKVVIWSKEALRESIRTILSRQKGFQSNLASRSNRFVNKDKERNLLEFGFRKYKSIQP